MKNFKLDLRLILITGAFIVVGVLLLRSFKKQHKDPTGVVVQQPKAQFCAAVSKWDGIGANDDVKIRELRIGYIQRFYKVAMSEYYKFGIPASIILAQGLIETQNGTSNLMKRTNNHFGIKCFSRSCKKGHCSNHSDDSHKDFFRTYPSAWESFRSHSLLLTSKRYKSLAWKDYKAWAWGLKNRGYATDKNYPNKLIKIISDYKLNRFDR